MTHLSGVSFHLKPDAVKRILEACCGNLESVDAAVLGGAPRIELCSRLDLDGLTPSMEELKEARRLYPSLCIMVLIRCREGNFVYSASEVSVMASSVREALSLGADGVVLGALTSSGDVDLPALEAFMKAADGASVTFHRAFDICREPFEALSVISGLGCSRVLTSGHAPSAYEGVSMLRELRLAAPPGLTILPGGGVAPGNAAAILDATGCTELHASASVRLPDGRKVTSAPIVASIISEMEKVRF